MNSHWLKKLSTTGLAIVAALALLLGCVAPATPVPPQPPVEPTKPAARDGYVCDPVDPEYQPAVALVGGHYILNQVIITGPASGVEQVVKELNARDAGLAPIQTCRLNHLLPEQPAAPAGKDEPEEEENKAKKGPGGAGAKGAPGAAGGRAAGGVVDIRPGQAGRWAREVVFASSPELARSLEARK